MIGRVQWVAHLRERLEPSGRPAATGRVLRDGSGRWPGEGCYPPGACPTRGTARCSRRPVGSARPAARGGAGGWAGWRPADGSNRSTAAPASGRVAPAANRTTRSDGVRTGQAPPGFPPAAGAAATGLGHTSGGGWWPRIRIADMYPGRPPSGIAARAWRLPPPSPRSSRPTPPGVWPSSVSFHRRAGPSRRKPGETGAGDNPFLRYNRPDRGPDCTDLS